MARDLNDYLKAGADLKVVISEGAEEWVERPELILTGDIEDKAQQILDAVRIRKKPKLYVRGRELVHVAMNDRGADRRAEAIIELITANRLACMLNQNFRLLKYLKMAKNGEMPVAVFSLDNPQCDQILLRSVHSFPPLQRIIRTPGLSPTGEPITRDGYRPDMAAWVDLGGLEIEIDQRIPTAEEARASLDTLTHIFCDFPFSDQAARANAIALMFLPFVRMMIDGPTPLWLTTASTPGTGKTLMLQAMGLLADGNEPNLRAGCGNEDEWRKVLTTILVGSTTFVIFDNLNRMLNSGSLAAMLTTRVWTDRLLGRNDKQLQLANDTIWTASANNPAISDEQTRRTVYITLTAPAERPWKRVGFAHSPLSQWIKQNRPMLIRAVHRCLRYWVSIGQPRWTGLPMGSFEECCAVLGGILESLGVDGFLSNRELIYDRVDTQTADIRAFVTAWWHRHGKNAVNVTDLHKLCADKDLLDWALGDGNERSQKSRLGRKMQKLTDRIYGSWRIQDGGRVKNVATYWLNFEDPDSQSPPTTDIKSGGNQTLL